MCETALHRVRLSLAIVLVALLAALLCTSAVILTACDTGNKRSSTIHATQPPETPTSAAATTGATVPPTTSPNPRDTAIALAAWLQSVVESDRPLGPLVETPRPTDADWGTELRAAAAAVKQTTAQRPIVFSMPCIAGSFSDIDQLVAALERIPDELLTAGDTARQAQFDIARRAFADIELYLTNAIAVIRRAPC